MGATLDKRTRLVRAAGERVQSAGFAATSLADIAAAADVPVGNLYYYFKTKDALGAAVIAAREQGYVTQRDAWERELEPRDRLLAFVAMAVDAREDLSQDGCPIGSLCSELQKSPGPLGDQAATLFANWLEWLQAQFRAIDRKQAEASADAHHLVASLQGATILAHALRSPDLIVNEADRLREWIESL